MIDSLGEACCGCSLCKEVCPKNCIKIEVRENGFWYPSISQDECIKCGLCKSMCPIYNPIVSECRNEGFVIRAIDQNVVDNSASGGFLTPVSCYFIENNGKIYGAGFDENWRIIHQRIDDKNNIHKIRGSKYVQSNMNNCYENIIVDLKQGRRVLFCGTPCQVQAVMKYAASNGVEKELYAVDVVCKGVGSPAIWNQYLRLQEKNHHSKIVHINFREKVHGYHSSNMVVRFQNGKKSSRSKTDHFMKAYVGEWLSRSSCYQCRFKGIDRCSDFTVFDAWHYSELNAGAKDDDKGYTCLIVHTEKGKKILDTIKSRYIISEIDINKAIELDGVMVNKQPITNRLRDEYLECAINEGIDVANKKYKVISPKDLMVEVIKGLLHRFGLLNFAKNIKSRKR